MTNQINFDIKIDSLVKQLTLLMSPGDPLGLVANRVSALSAFGKR